MFYNLFLFLVLFSTDFTHLANFDAYSSRSFGLDSAILRLISEFEAKKYFGIARDMFLNIKHELKDNRKISEKTIKVFFN